MNKLKNKTGMTMAEMLIVVAIIVVLSGVAFAAVNNHQRSLGQLERDGIAKEIFVAAQNHLTAAYGEGYLGISEFGYEDTVSDEAIKDDYYIVVNGGTVSSGGQGIFDLMLPFGSIDETVRTGGSYIVRYQKDTGLVLDVFYCSRNGSPNQYNYVLKDSDYSDVLDLRDTEGRNKKPDRRNWNSHVLGWYGGTEAATLPTTTLLPPTIKVINAEKLYVEVSNPNSGNSDAELKLIITGLDSGAQKAYEFTGTDDRVRSVMNDYTVILDDVASWGVFSGLHFGNIVADTESTTGEKFIPGEDITIQAVAFSTKVLANIAYSSKYTTNSLFGSINTAKDTAYIGNIRHLENLDVGISRLDTLDDRKAEIINITHAEQTDSFSWIGFQKAVKEIESKSDSGEPSEEGYETVCVYDFSGTDSGEGHYMPIAPDYALTYDGKSRSISDVAVDVTGAAVDVTEAATGDAGLFGKIEEETVSEIKNLELIDFTVKGTDSAGALAGTLDGCTVTNVLARNSAASSTAGITSATDAGGLIGKLASGTVQYSAASVIVGDSTNPPTNAGGLIGNASGTITGCYSGGHTKNGSYEEWVAEKDTEEHLIHSYDVTGVTVGGLVGTASAAISDSYSTCSAYTTSVTGTAGGFAGSASGRISNCYATGLVEAKSETNEGTTTTGMKYAFVASGSPVLSENWYYKAINEVPKEGGKEGETEPMLPVSGYVLAENLESIKPIDLNAKVYNTFIGKWEDWNPARAFDSALVKYYSGSYTLETVDELNATLPDDYNDWNELFVMTHYGDWPSPEVFFINTAS